MFEEEISYEFIQKQAKREILERYQGHGCFGYVQKKQEKHTEKKLRDLKEQVLVAYFSNKADFMVDVFNDKNRVTLKN